MVPDADSCRSPLYSPSAPVVRPFPSNPGSRRRSSHHRAPKQPLYSTFPLPRPYTFLKPRLLDSSSAPSSALFLSDFLPASRDDFSPRLSSCLGPDPDAFVTASRHTSPSRRTPFLLHPGSQRSSSSRRLPPAVTPSRRRLLDTTPPMHPTRLSLSDARISALETLVARLVGRVTVLESRLPSDFLPASPEDLRTHSPLRASVSDSDAFVAASLHSSPAPVAGPFPLRTPVPDEEALAAAPLQPVPTPDAGSSVRNRPHTRLASPSPTPHLRSRSLDR